MDTSKLIADFNQLYFDLRSHPYLIDFPEKSIEFHKLYSQLLITICDYSSFLNSITALTYFFQDGHTNIEIPYQCTDLCIPIRCTWKHERLLVDTQYAEIPSGAELIAVEDTPVYLIIKELSNQIPHENIFLVKSRAVEYPYVNYHMFSKQNLAALFGDKTEYLISYQYNGKVKLVALNPVPYNGYLDFCDDHFAAWEINGSNAVLKLNACICNYKYENVLQELAYACHTHNVTDLTLDLSHNMGGTSEVIEKFLEYVNIDSFRRYEMIDYSSGKPERLCSRQEIIVNKKKTFLFPDRINCKISNTTFSSAKTFAVMLKDNGVASIIGEPTGGKPSSYGMPQKRTLLHTSIRYRVSRAWFGRPSSSLDLVKTLTPD